MTKEGELLQTVRISNIIAVRVVSERQMYWRAKKMLEPLSHSPRHSGNSQSLVTGLHIFITWLLLSCSSEVGSYTRIKRHIKYKEQV